MGQAISVVDAFTDAAFRGNPAAVCLLPRPTTEAWMQSVAAEMNLSETAFAVPRSDGGHDLRWFTPTTEVDLCGHATLATAHVLGGEARFHTRSGPLTCRPGNDGTVEMDFPATPVEPVTDSPDWSAPLGVGAERVAGVWAGSGWLMVELAAAADVREVRPDLAAIVALCDVVAVVAPGDRPGVDSVCRVFGPGVGIDEDPVTGSAHCMIAPWLAARTGGSRFTGEQVSARGGTVGMRLAGDRVVLAGRAVTVLEGTLLSDPPPA
jgi:predicted PhzF superfamily epimerase YddE/YHI9